MVIIPKKYSQYFIAGVSLILALNIIWLQSAVLSLVFGLFWLLATSWFIGKKLIPTNVLSTLSLGLLSNLALIGTLGSIIYHLWNLSNWPIIFILLCITSLTVTWARDIQMSWEGYSFAKWHLLIVTYFILISANFYQLWLHRTDEALRSTWQVLPNSFWILITISTLLLLYIQFFEKPLLSLNIIHALLFVSVALIIYKIGYGYDPFIHLATEEHIARFGFIEPKKFYYLGLYAPLIFLHKITGLSLSFLNASLVPLLAGLTLPAATNFLLSHYHKNQFTLAVLAIPFSTFIMTTPQNLANLYLIIAAMLALAINPPLIILVIFTLGAIFTHPIAGLPLLALCLLVIANNRAKYKKTLKYASFILGLGGFIMAFGLLALISPFQFTFGWQNTAWQKLLPFSTSWRWAGQWLIDIVYTYSTLLLPLIIISVVLYVWYCKKEKNYLPPHLIIIAFLIINIIGFAYFIDFPFLISYERLDFAKRLLDIIILLALPLVLVLLAQLPSTKKWLTIISIPGLAIFLLSSFYLSYPRYDSHEKNKGFSVSQHDFNTVKIIAQEANHNSYLVLANQNLGAAALATFGFSKHYIGPDAQPQYFYSIPTGGWLYQYFYKIAEKKEPLQPTLKQVFIDFPEINSIFLVLNDYWFNREQIAKTAETFTNQIINIDQGKLLVWRFDRF